nr:MAG TPA: hypothetical protein [Caudoviricetes sp.]
MCRNRPNPKQLVQFLFLFRFHLQPLLSHFQSKQFHSIDHKYLFVLLGNLN